MENNLLQNLPTHELNILWNQSKKMSDKYWECLQDTGEDDGLDNKRYRALWLMFDDLGCAYEGEIEKRLIQHHKELKANNCLGEEIYNPFFDESLLEELDPTLKEVNA